jgi:hypothetical protein
MRRGRHRAERTRPPGPVTYVSKKSRSVRAAVCDCLGCVMAHLAAQRVRRGATVSMLQKFPRLARILFYGVLGLAGIVVLFLATIQIQLRVFRHRAERLSGDVTAIQPRRTIQVELTENESRHRVRTPFLRCGAVLDFAKQFCARKFLRSDCRWVELRALCNDSPQTPPGPEGSNGSGSVSCAAEYPKFL